MTGRSRSKENNNHTRRERFSTKRIYQKIKEIPKIFHLSNTYRQFHHQYHHQRNKNIYMQPLPATEARKKVSTNQTLKFLHQTVETLKVY